MPVGRLIGFEMKEVAEGRAAVTLEAGPQHANPMGTLHGGILCDIADAAMGMAFASTLSPDESFTTVELKINFFRPVWKAFLRADGKVVRRGSTIGYTECEISDDHGQLVAKAAATCLILRGEQAAEGKQTRSDRGRAARDRVDPHGDRKSRVAELSRAAVGAEGRCDQLRQTRDARAGGGRRDRLPWRVLPYRLSQRDLAT
jgi:uncharacterized protein (TIGR00369 family)